MVPIVCTEAERERNGIWERDHMYGEGTTSDRNNKNEECTEITEIAVH